MRYAIISDIHSNLVALNQVLDHIKKRGIKEIICLGDVVGYGPKPIECIELIMQNCYVCLKGNHDEAMVEGVCFFNPVAKNAIEWTREYLLGVEHPQKEEMWSFISDLPMTYILDKEYMFVHGSPLDPTMDYILTRDLVIEEKKFEDIFDSFENILFTGHTHLPCVITDSMEAFSIKELGYKYKFSGQKAIINVGSVGQPRDKDPSSCYVEVVDDFVFFHRVPYDCEKVYQEILENPKLDPSLGRRLLTGT